MDIVVYGLLKKRIDEIAESAGIKREIVTELPDPSTAKDNVIYMIKDESASGDNVYKEYLLINDSFELIGDTSVPLGDYAKRSIYGDTTVSVNRKADTTVGENSATIGQGNTASALNSIALGTNNTVTGAQSVATGMLNTVSGSGGSFAAGFNNTLSINQGGFAIGSGNTASGGNGGAVGSSNTIDGSGFAFGTSNNVSNNGLAVGFGNKATRGTDILVGSGNVNNATGQATMIGTGNVSANSANYSTEIGTGNSNAGSYSFLAGYGNTNAAADTLIVGRDNKGTTTTSTGMAVGYKNELAHRGYLAGSNNKTLNNDSVAFGISNQVSYRGVALGLNNTVNNLSDANTYGVALGDTNTLKGRDEIALGEYNIVSGRYSTAIGFSNVVSGEASTALGKYLEISANNQTVLGCNNVKDEDGKYAFIIGDGTDSTPLNRFAVTHDGTVEVTDAEGNVKTLGEGGESNTFFVTYSLTGSVDELHAESDKTHAEISAAITAGKKVIAICVPYAGGVSGTHLYCYSFSAGPRETYEFKFMTNNGTYSITHKIYEGEGITATYTENPSGGLVAGYGLKIENGVISLDVPDGDKEAY